MTRLLLPICAAALATTSCTMIPRMQRPDSPVPERFVGGGKHPANIADIPWRTNFTDARLRRLIEIALENNRDLRVAILNVEQARAQYRIQRAEIIPQASASGSYTRSRTSALGATGAFGGLTTDQFDASVGLVSYELDLFGRIRSLNRKQLETYFAQAENHRSTHITLISQVAIQYLALIEYQEQLALARETLASVQGTYDLTKKKMDAGAGSEIDVSAADVQVQTARVNIHIYERLAGQAANALALLIGQPLPGNLPSGRRLSEQRLLSAIPSGLSSDLIQRRPDILAAEHTLLAANADIGAARAAFFPTISLSSSIGGSSTQLGKLFNKPGQVWNFSPQVTVPIFTGGRNKASLDAAKLTKRSEIATYEKTIQTAFREVSDALVARSSYTHQLSAQEALVSAQQKRFDLATSKYDGGIGSYLDVLTAQQDLFNARLNLVTTRAARQQNLVTLYKALGGGWQ